MKTPREILLAQHRAAGPKLDAIRRAVMADKFHAVFSLVGLHQFSQGFLGVVQSRFHRAELCLRDARDFFE